MPSRQPKPILKKSGKQSHGTSSHASRPGKPGPGPSSLDRNTKMNAGSKFQKTLQVKQKPRKEEVKAPEQLVEDESGDEAFGVEDEDEDMEGKEGSEVDTDEEIARGPEGTKKKSTKRKRSATTAETFGSTLTSLLSESSKKPKKSAKGAAPVADVEGEDGDVAKSKLAGKAAGQPQNNILSLSHIKAPPSRAAENLERKAKRHIQALKMEKEDKARVRDVVEGWAARHVEGGPEVLGGQEFEKGLRKTAQRGVIKLFNAILIAAKNAEAATTSLSAKAGVKDEPMRGKKEKDNVMGRGNKDSVLTQESFLDLVRKG